MERTAESSKKVNPRDKTLVDLKKYVTKEIDPKRKVILMMDANECAAKRSEEMSALVQGCGLVDSHLLADLYSEVETYARGKGKIDYILVTPRVQLCMRYMNIAPYNEWIVSDHRALIIDIDYQTLEKGELAFFQREERSFQTNSAKDRRKFVEECHKLGARMNWLARLERIKKVADIKEAEKELNKLDKEVTQVLVSQAEKRRKKPGPPRSANVNQAILSHLMWKIALHGIKTKRCFRDRLNQLATKLKTSLNQEEWWQPREVAKRLRKASKVRKQAEREAPKDARKRGEHNK